MTGGQMHFRCALKIETSRAGEEKLRNKEELNKSKRRTREEGWKGDATPH